MVMNKGSLFDVIFFLIVAGIVMVTVVISYSVLGAFNSNTDVQTMLNQTDTTGQAQHALNQGVVALNTFDAGIAFFILMSGLITIGLATMTGSNPVFFFGSLIILIVIVAVSAIISNVFVTILSADQLATTSNNFPITMALLGIYPTICLVISIIVAIVSYSRPSSVRSFG